LALRDTFVVLEAVEELFGFGLDDATNGFAVLNGLTVVEL
jgi:hypothetical protein